MASQFSSDGFDLDAVPDIGDGGDDVVYEVGGAATAVAVEKEVTLDEKSNGNNDNEAKDDEDKEISPTDRSEEFKAQGNEEFKKQNFLEACDMYTEAIKACPGMTGEEILALREKFEEEENEKLYDRQRLEAEARRKLQQDQSGDKTPEEKHKDAKQQEETPVLNNRSEFKAPPHPHGENLAIYHCNRAACYLHLENYTDAVKDGDVAVLLRPDWPKAYLRRSTAFEKTEKTEDALMDAKKALELDPSNTNIKKTVARLQKLEDQRLEKLKEETLGKLKDLGNSLLSNFGLSLDNFQAKQDPNTGSYSISFDQGAGKS